jgi:hypothetical protein
LVACVTGTAVTTLVGVGLLGLAVSRGEANSLREEANRTVVKAALCSWGASKPRLAGSTAWPRCNARPTSGIAVHSKLDASAQSASGRGQRGSRLRYQRLWVTRGGTALIATTACLLFLADGCGSARALRLPGKVGQLIGQVSICPSIGPGPCSRTRATVTVLEVHGTTLGRPVAKMNTTTGRFRFSLPPGKYFPSGSGVYAKNGIRCIAGEPVVSTGHVVRDEVRCYPRVRPST